MVGFDVSTSFDVSLSELHDIKKTIIRIGNSFRITLKII